MARIIGKQLLHALMLLSVAAFIGCASSDNNEADIGADEMAEEIAAAEGSDSSQSDDLADEEADFEEEEVASADEPAEEMAEEPAQEVAQAEQTPEQEADELEQEFEQEEPAEQQAALETDSQEPSGFESLSPADESPKVLVTGINFLANQNGGTIAIKTSGPVKYTTRYNAKTQQYVVELMNTQLSAAMKRPYIMKDFETPFGAINAYQNSGSSTARIVVQLKTGGEPVVQQEGDSLIVLPPSAEAIVASGTEAPRKKEAWEESYDIDAADKAERILGARSLDEFLTGSGRFYGRPISIQTNDADIRDVINFIAEESGVNLVIGDDVEGKISLKLRQVPWDQALVIVMKAKNLGYIRQGNVLRITRLQTLQEEAKAAKSIVDAQKGLTPLRVKVLPISYAVVSDLEKQILPFLTTDRGKVVSDSRTSSLIVTDTADVLEKVERLVKELDIPPAQVMIEGKIVEATESFKRTLGVNWSWDGAPLELSPSGGYNGGKVQLQTGWSVNNIADEVARAAAGRFDLTVGRLDFLGDLSATLALAQADSLIKIVSSPRIVTMNKEKAEISQKGEVVSVNKSVDANGQPQSTQVRTPVELRLTVSPQITNEGSVLLDIDVIRQFAGVEVDPDTKARAVNSRAAKTKVLVPNGQTAVIGGIYQSEDSTSENGVPGLKDIPVLGWLFKSKTDERAKNELIIFLTPRILNAKDQSVSSN